MKRLMKALAALVAMGMVQGLESRGQAEVDWQTVDQAVKAGTEWVEDQAGVKLGDLVDLQQVQEVFRHLESAFQGESLFDLAPLREEAVTLLATLQQFEQTRPYAAWLSARMDYFDVITELMGPEPEPPPPVPGSPRRPPPPVKRPNPTAAQQRRVWEKKVASRPSPRGADPLVPGLKRIFAQHGTPEALVWLAEVESSFNPTARSPVGALGLFQFMPKTATSLGLKLAPEDERRDPNRSASAAARYLNQLHGRFQDWPLALAAYNAGQGRVGGLLKKHDAKSFDEIATFLPAETQMYVPKIEATLRRREGLALNQLPGPSKGS